MNEFCGKLSSRRALRIALVTLGLPGCTYDSMPRGTAAIDHYLREFGHTVLWLDRTVTIHPWRLMRRLREFNPDVILVQHFIAGVVAVLHRCGFLRCPVVHAWDDYYAEQSRFPRWLVWPLEVLGVRWADHVTTVSMYNLHLVKKWGVPCTYIPHGIHEPTKETPLRLQSEKLKVAYLGDQDAYKGVGNLIEAVRGMDCDLFMVGIPNPALQGCAPANVHFVGAVPPEEVQAVLAQADVLANPSDQDSNFKFFEYVKARKPILGVKGKAEWAFRNGEDALLVDDLRAGIQRMLVDGEIRKRLGDSLRERDVISWMEHARRIDEVLQHMVRAKPDGRVPEAR